MQKSADFYDKMECDRRKQLYLKIYQSVSAYSMKVNEKRSLGRVTLTMLVRRLILKMQVDIQREQYQKEGLGSEEFAAFIFTKATK